MARILFALHNQFQNLVDGLYILSTYTAAVHLGGRTKFIQFGTLVCEKYKFRNYWQCVDRARGLRSLAAWGWGFEFRQGPGCLLIMLQRQTSLRRSDSSSKKDLTSVCVCVYARARAPFSVIGCNSNPLHVQSVDRRRQTQKEGKKSVGWKAVFSLYIFHQVD